ncbi:MAG: hypothetical protein WBD27_01975 [Pyrinomonadaceae bacterium]
MKLFFASSNVVSPKVIYTNIPQIEIEATPPTGGIASNNFGDVDGKAEPFRTSDGVAGRNPVATAHGSDGGRLG